MRSTNARTRPGRCLRSRKRRITQRLRVCKRLRRSVGGQKQRLQQARRQSKGGQWSCLAGSRLHRPRLPGCQYRCKPQRCGLPARNVCRLAQTAIARCAPVTCESLNGHVLPDLRAWWGDGATGDSRVPRTSGWGKWRCAAPPSRAPAHRGNGCWRLHPLSRGRHCGRPSATPGSPAGGLKSEVQNPPRKVSVECDLITRRSNGTSGGILELRYIWSIIT